MNLLFSPEQEAWRKEIREFLDRELPPEFETETEFDDREHIWSFAQQFSKKVGDKGWATVTWPKEYGGLDKPTAFQFILAYEFNYRGAPLINDEGIGLAGNTILKFGTDEQKRRFLPDIAHMRTLWAEGFSEPNAGSDLASLQTRADRQGADWVVNGQKTPITWAHRCDVLSPAARPDPQAPKHKGISIFCMPLKAPGVQFQPLYNIAGGRQNHLYMDNVRVPGDMIIGEPNKGWHYISSALYGALQVVAPYARLKRSFDELVKFCRETRVNGKALSKDPYVRDRLADLAVDFEALKALQYEELWAAERKIEPPLAGALGPLVVKEFFPKFATVALEVLGTQGQMVEGSPGAILGGRFNKLFMQSFGTHAGGTSQLKRMVIATRTLGLPR